MGLVHRQARIPISGFGCPKMHAMVGVSLRGEMDGGRFFQTGGSESGGQFLFFSRTVMAPRSFRAVELDGGGLHK